FLSANSFHKSNPPDRWSKTLNLQSQRQGEALEPSAELCDVLAMKKTALLLFALSLCVFAPAAAIAAGPDGGKAITGTVSIAPALKGKIGQTAALYIIARPNG